jgi:AbrB family looped-hinge helix DNA binding protein
MTTAVKITRKGQVTIPKKIRDILKTNSVYFEIENNNIVVRPVRDAAGSLSEYAKNVSAGTPFEKIKEKAWEDAVREKTSKKSS